MLISCKYRKITAITYYCEAFGTRNWIESLESWIKIAFRRKFIVPKSFLYNSTLRYLLCRLKVVGWIDKFCTFIICTKIKFLISFQDLFTTYTLVLLYIESVFRSYVFYILLRTKEIILDIFRLIFTRLCILI